MKRLIIWRATDVRSGESFYVLRGFSERYALFENDKLSVGYDFSSFAFGKWAPSVNVTFKDRLLLNVPYEKLSTDDEISAFCMIHGVDSVVGSLLQFAYENRKEIYCED